MNTLESMPGAHAPGQRPARAFLLALFCVAGMLVCGNAWAGGQDGTVASPQEPLPVCSLDPHDSNKLAVEPCRPAPPVRPRRAVAQVIGHMPRQMPPPEQHFSALPPTSAAPIPSAPIPIGSCDLGGCRDASGARYNGAGNTTLDANGRICQRNGAFLQCF